MNTQKALIKLENKNFEYVLSEDSLIPGDDVVQVGEEYQSVVYADGSEAVLLQGHEYYIQTGDGETFMLENDQESLDQLIINNEEQSEEGIEYIQAEEDTENSIVYEIGSKRLKLENGQFITLTDSDTDELGRAEELSILNSVNNGESSIQYAVLKDGQLHLQLADDDTVEILNSPNGQLTDNTDSNFSMLHVYSEEEEEDGEAENIDFSKITGRNVLTGKTVNLNDYIDRIRRSSKKDDQRLSDNLGVTKPNQFVNQKFEIGKVPSGKFLIGKILNIQPSKTKETVEKDTVVGEEEYETEKTETVTELTELPFNDPDNILEGPKEESNEDPSEEQLTHLTKILNGLTDMESLHKKLLGRKLHIKLVEKRIGNGRVGKSVTYVNGFLGDSVTENGETERNEYVFNMLRDFQDYEIVECVEETGEVILKQSAETDSTSLTVLVTTDSNDQKTTRVTFSDSPSQSNYCAVCSMHFKTPAQLNRHVTAWHPDVSKGHEDHNFICALCDKRFTSRGSLRRHTVSVHETTKDKNDSGNFTIQQTSKKAGAADLHCTSCNKTFDCVMQFHYHQRLHAQKLFYCETCGREFSRHSNLLRHAEIHQGDVHRCNICGCSYKYISSLTRHIVQNHVEKV